MHGQSAGSYTYLLQTAILLIALIITMVSLIHPNLVHDICQDTHRQSQYHNPSNHARFLEDPLLRLLQRRHIRRLNIQVRLLARYQRRHCSRPAYAAFTPLLSSLPSPPHPQLLHFP